MKIGQTVKILWYGNTEYLIKVENIGTAGITGTYKKLGASGADSQVQVAYTFDWPHISRLEDSTEQLVADFLDLHPVGEGYNKVTIDRTLKTVTVGCNTFPWSDVEALQKALKG